LLLSLNNAGAARRSRLQPGALERAGQEPVRPVQRVPLRQAAALRVGHDDEPGERFCQISPEMWEADARVELDDLAEAIDAKLAEVDEDVDTLGGLAFVIAGQVPNIGQMLLHDASGWRLEILEADEKRVSKIRLFAPVPVPEEENP